MKSDEAAQSADVHGREAESWWHFLALLLLWLPSAVWLGLVFRPVVSVPLVLAVGWVLAQVLPDRAGARPFRAQALRTLLPAGIFASCWSALTGLLGVFHLNRDWYWRLEVLQQFSQADWASYHDGPRHFLLRFPGAYYALVAPFCAHLSMGAARALLWACTALVASCALGALFQAGLRWMALFLVAIFATNGMDVLGELAVNSAFPAPGAHIEWWSGQQYSGLTTGMIWVPNHLLPALLFVSTLPLLGGSVTHERLTIVALAAAGTVLWSPLVFAGAVPIVVGLGLSARGELRASRIPARRLASLGAPLAVLLIAAILYVTYLTGKTPRGWALSFCREGRPLCISKMVAFYALEAVPLAVPCLLLPQRGIGLSCVFTLLVLPQLFFGPANDLEMRASFPAIVVSAFAVCLFVEGHARHWSAVAALLVVVLEGYGAYSEVTRALEGFDQPPWQPAGLGDAFRAHFPKDVDGYAPHYMIPFADACRGALGGVLRGCDDPG